MYRICNHKKIRIREKLYGQQSFTTLLWKWTVLIVTQRITFTKCHTMLWMYLWIKGSGVVYWNKRKTLASALVSYAYVSVFLMMIHFRRVSFSLTNEMHDFAAIKLNFVLDVPLSFENCGIQYFRRLNEMLSVYFDRIIHRLDSPLANRSLTLLEDSVKRNLIMFCNDFYPNGLRNLLEMIHTHQGKEELSSNKHRTADMKSI